MSPPPQSPPSAAASLRSDEDWIDVRPVDELEPGAMSIFRHGGHQLVVGRTEDGELFALDNRCPHEGYSLAQGDLKGCALTCCWHNWKFDVRDGSCTLGGEGVRAHATRVVEGRVQVDVAPPDPAGAIEALRTSFFEGLDRGEVGRVLRDAARMLQFGRPAIDVLRDVAVHDARHAEYGSTHTLPIAAEGARLIAADDGLHANEEGVTSAAERSLAPSDSSSSYPSRASCLAGPNALHAIAPAIELEAETNARRPPRPRPEPVPVSPVSWSVAGALEVEIARAIEKEDVARAEALLLGAIDAGAPLDVVERVLFASISLHLTNFGHHLIYLTKLRELATDAPRAVLRELASSLLFAAGRGTRADTLPYMRTYREAFAEWEGELDELASGCSRAADERSDDGGANGARSNGARSNGDPSNGDPSSGVPSNRPRSNDPQSNTAEPAFDLSPLLAAILDGTSRESMDRFREALRARVPLDRIAETLVLAAAHRLWRFDEAVDRDPNVAETWLWVTHRFTHASAVREACHRFGGAGAIRALFHSVAFLHSGRPMDRGESMRALPAPISGEDLERDVADWIDAIVQKEAGHAAALGQTFAADPNRRVRARRALEDLCLHDPLVRPIFVAHAWKTGIAAFDEAERLPPRAAALALAAASRFLATPIAERRLREAVDTTLRWVVDGQMPRKLTQ